MLLLALPDDDDVTFGLIVDNLFINIDDAIFAAGFTVVVLVGSSVLKIVVVGGSDGDGADNSNVLVLLTDFGIDIGLIALDVTFSL